MATKIYPIGRPGEVAVESNSGFTAGATVRLEVLTPGFAKVLDTEYVPVDRYGGISQWPTPSCSSEYAHLNVYP